MTNPIEIQLQALQSNRPHINIIEPFSIEYNSEALDLSSHQSDFNDLTIFTPASGIGSRMFKFLFSYVEDGKESDEVRTFFKNLHSLPFYQLLKDKLGDLNSYSQRDIAYQVLNNIKEISPANPKGLIPIHNYDGQVLNAFQEYVLYTEDHFPNAQIEFTIKDSFQSRIADSIGKVSQKNIKYSYQDTSSDAFVFDSNNHLVYHQGIPLRRPSGHGALLNNLDDIDTNYILIKNIDNIQRQDFDYAAKTQVGMLKKLLEIEFKRNEFLEKLNKRQIESLEVEHWLKEEGMLYPNTQNLRRDELISLLDAPIRVCGMVKNTGQPGGGPFWVKGGDDIIRPQIIEAIQIQEHPDSMSLLENATHFNPVNIACSTRKADGTKYNLQEFVNPEEYFIVEKDHMGKAVKYIEKPGLWNGSMSKWLTKFVEVDLSTFSPIKTVLNLLDPSHQPSDTQITS